MDDFNVRINKAIKETIESCNYKPTGFIHMVNELGAVEAAKRLLLKNTVSDGYIKLYEKDRLDLSVEAIVLEYEFSGIFTEKELYIARKRLNEFNYKSTVNGSRWTDQELLSAVNTYLKMLTLQEDGINFKKIDFINELQLTELRGRTKSSIEYRFQNISSIMKELSMPFVQG